MVNGSMHLHFLLLRLYICRRSRHAERTSPDRIHGPIQHRNCVASTGHQFQFHMQIQCNQMGRYCYDAFLLAVAFLYAMCIGVAAFILT